MAKNISGKELKAFYADPTFWPDDSYQDDTEFLFNGKVCTELPELKDSDVIQIRAGMFVYENDKKYILLQTAFNQWKKKQTMTHLVIELDVSKEAEVRKALLSMGVKII